jgi:hypothetical protein
MHAIIERGFQTLPDLLAGPGEAERPRGLLKSPFEADRSATNNDVQKRLMDILDPPELQRIQPGECAIGP